MNEKAAQILFDADRNRVRQIRGAIADSNGGRCAMGVLQGADPGLALDICHTRVANQCPLCGNYLTARGIVWEDELIVHLNDWHELTFAEIARKLGPDCV